MIPFNDKGTLTFSPVRGRHYLVARGNTAIREIFYDADTPAPLLPILPLIPFFERIMKFRFMFKALMTEQDAKARNLQPILTFEKNVSRANESADSVTPQKMSIVMRTIEDQYYLLDQEIHPFHLTVTSSDNSEVGFVFKFTAKVNDMNRALSDYPGGNFLMIVDAYLVGQLNLVLQKKTLSDLRGITHQGIQKELADIIDQGNEKFRSHGFEILNIMYEELVILPLTEERIRAGQNVEIAKLNKETTVINGQATAAATRETRAAEIQMKKKETQEVGSAQVEIQKKKLANIVAFNKENSKIVSENQRIKYASLGRVRTLVLRDGDDKSFDGALDANLATDDNS